MQNPARPGRMTAWPLAISYVLFFLYWPLAALASLAHFVTSLRHSGRHSGRAALLVLVLSPFILIPLVSFAWGAVGYATGSGRLVNSGVPKSGFRNLDPQYRCYRSSSGSYVDGSELFTNAPNNLAIRMLVGAFGPMPGTYHGPYPEVEEAFELLRGGRIWVPADDIHNNLGDVGLPLTLTERKAKRSVNRFYDFGKGDLKFANYEDATIILGDHCHAVLIDKETGESYASYEDAERIVKSDCGAPPRRTPR